MDGKSIADSIKQEICERNITAYALGKMTGVSAVTIQRFLTGERGLTLATAEKLARTLGLGVCRREVASAALESGAGQEDDGQNEGLQLFDLDLSRGLRIGDGVMVRLVSINRGSVRIVIEAPPEASVLRGEVLEAKGIGTERPYVRSGT
jgi:carbon storage regulator CsrA